MKLFTLVTVVCASTIDLWLRYDDGSVASAGTIHYNEEEKTAGLNLLPDIPTGKYCIGTSLHHECIATASIDPSELLFRLHLNEKGEVKAVSRSSGTGVVVDLPSGPVPILNPESLKSIKNAPPPKQRKKTKEGKEKGKGDTEEEEDNRSWIQKNWMFVVIPLLLFLMVGGEAEKPKTA